MILSVLAALHVLRSLEHFNVVGDKILSAGPVGDEVPKVKELQGRVNGLMWSEYSKGPSTMLRWLRFNKMNVDKAEEGIISHAKWRKELDMDRFRVDPKMLKLFFYNFTGHAKNGDPVIVTPFGDWDIRGYTERVNNSRAFEQHQCSMLEKCLLAVEKVELNFKKSRREPVRCLIITDLNNLQYRQLSSYKALQYIYTMAINMENNYPEIQSQSIMINSDWVFDALFRLTKPLMERSAEKVKVFPKERAKWEKYIRRLVNPTVLPFRYGGYSKTERRT